jgi:1-pyrroline-5-carboxylate dehydrogenase
MPVTYASLTNVDEEVAAGLKAGLDAARASLGLTYPVQIGADVQDDQEAWHEEHSPIDDRILIGNFAWATVKQAQAALQLAYDTFGVWSNTPIAERAAILRRSADRLEAQRYKLAGQITFEAGKTSAEALAEADEAPVFLRLYADEFERTNGFTNPMPSETSNESNISVMRPYGVWAVISPLNFPLALATGPTAAALITGNTVVLKPSPAAQLMAVTLREALLAEGLPPGALTVLNGGGEVGAAITSSDMLGGVTFTGSYAVGSHIATELAPRSKPVIAEMGGKNPAIVGPTADLDEAAEGIIRAAFGYSGQKCSACSRVFVEQSRYEEFIDLLLAKAAAWTVGDPTKRGVSTGPLTSQAAVDRFIKSLEEVRAAGGRVLTGGHVITDSDLAHGNYVVPAVVEAPESARVWRDELFAPIIAVRPVADMEEALQLANANEYGLTAGIYSHDDVEIQKFYDGIEASVLYVNRRAGATTGAWPGQQPISGWKHSGNTGRGTAGPHYLQQYLREQSRTVVTGG